MLLFRYTNTSLVNASVTAKNAGIGIGEYTSLYTNLI